MLAGDLLQNPDLATDVNDDGYTSPVDALHVINELNTRGARSLRNEVRTAGTNRRYSTTSMEMNT